MNAKKCVRILFYAGAEIPVARRATELLCAAEKQQWSGEEALSFQRAFFQAAQALGVKIQGWSYECGGYDHNGFYTSYSSPGVLATLTTPSGSILNEKVEVRNKGFEVVNNYDRNIPNRRVERPYQGSSFHHDDFELEMKWHMLRGPSVWGLGLQHLLQEKHGVSLRPHTGMGHPVNQFPIKVLEGLQDGELSWDKAVSLVLQTWERETELRAEHYAPKPYQHIGELLLFVLLLPQEVKEGLEDRDLYMGQARVT